VHNVLVLIRSRLFPERTANTNFGVSNNTVSNADTTKAVGVGPNPDSGSVLPPKFNGDSLVQGYICDEIFTKIQSVCPDIYAKL